MNGFDITWVWAFGILGLAAGFGVGVFVGYRFLTNKQRTAELELELDAAKAERQDYQQHVTAHFAKTAELFQDMTASYRGVYQHLAEGASQLCDQTSQAARLDPSDTLGLGEPRPASSPVAQEDVSAQENTTEPPVMHAEIASPDATSPEETSPVEARQENAPPEESSMEQSSSKEVSSPQTPAQETETSSAESTKPRFQTEEQKPETQEPVAAPTAANAANEFDSSPDEDDKAVLH